ncbi:MAG TPA: hypothetical protein VGF34_00900 [Stellaceae bacterium]|jgi:hypothetical protein
MDDNNQRPAANAAGSMPIDELIERWWEDHFPGSAVARETQAWNAAHAAKETLKRLLAQVHSKFSKGSV